MDASPRRPSVLLTGGAGYIGSHIAVVLQGAGYEVSILDRFSNSDPSVVEAITSITGRAPKLYGVDLLNRSALSTLFESNRFDGVVHLAGLKAVGESSADPGRYYRENLTGLLNLLDAMREHSVGKLVYSSSATVYGQPEFLPYTEDHPVGIGVTNPYGWTKAMGEQIIRDYGSYGARPIGSISLRYFNPIGAHSSGLIGEDPQGIPNNLMPYITRVAAGRLQELQIFGDDYWTEDGSCERDYIHVMDLARAHLAALEGLLRGKELAAAYNIGTGRPVSVFELVAAFESATGVQIPRRVALRRAGDLPVFFADPTAAQLDLGWSAELTIEDACRDAWRFESGRLQR